MPKFGGFNISDDATSVRLIVDGEERDLTEDEITAHIAARTRPTERFAGARSALREYNKRMRNGYKGV